VSPLGVLVALTAGLANAALPVDAGPPPLIPRAVLLADAEFSSPQLSPDGALLAYVRPDARGVAQLWTRTLGLADDAQVTHEAITGVQRFRWTEDGSALLYPRDGDGDERTHVLVVELSTKQVKDLTPWPGSKSEVLETHPRFPEVVLVTTNRRDARVFDVVRLNWKTGVLVNDAINPGDVVQWVVDPDFQVRAARASLPNGGFAVRVRESARSPWRALITASEEDSARLLDFTADGKSLLMTSTISSDTERVIEKSLASGTERLLATHPSSDVLDVLWNRQAHALRAVSFEVKGRREWSSFEGALTSELDPLKRAVPGDLELVSADRADSRWVIAASNDTSPTMYVLWDRKTRHATPLGSAFPALQSAPLVTMTPVTFRARDGLPLTGFLTLPGAPRPPLVVLVHDGPWAKDRLGYSPTVQWLTNRGAAVLQVNFRGSTGRGKRFVARGHRQWGLAMQDDLTDAVSSLGQQGLVDEGRVALMGQGYGGYATLMGLVKTPERYRCGVALSAPTRLVSMLEQGAPWRKPFAGRLARRVGDVSSATGKAALDEASPSTLSGRLTAPVLLGQGLQDPHLDAAQAEAFFTAATGAGRPVTLVVYSDEGHTLRRLENRLDFAARAEALLSRCLSLRAEPMPPGGRVPGSSAEVRGP